MLPKLHPYLTCKHNVLLFWTKHKVDIYMFIKQTIIMTIQLVSQLELVLQPNIKLSERAHSTFA